MTASDSETFCLQWNDFVKNVTSSASGSLTFKDLLKQNPNPNVLIFMRGVQSSLLKLIVDFIYCGEVSVHQDKLNEFLALAEDLQLRGLTESDASEAEPKT